DGAGAHREGVVGGDAALERDGVDAFGAVEYGLGGAGGRGGDGRHVVGADEAFVGLDGQRRGGIGDEAGDVGEVHREDGFGDGDGAGDGRGRLAGMRGGLGGFYDDLAGAGEGERGAIERGGAGDDFEGDGQAGVGGGAKRQRGVAVGS